MLVFVELKKIPSHLDEEWAFAIPIENAMFLKENNIQDILDQATNPEVRWRCLTIDQFFSHLRLPQKSC